MVKAKRTRTLFKQQQLEYNLRKSLFMRADYRQKQKVPIEVYLRCAELRYGKAKGSSQTKRYLSPEVLDVAAFTFAMYRLSPHKLRKIEELGIPNGVLKDLSTLPLPVNWSTLYRAIINRDARLGYLYFSEIGRYMYQHENSQTRSAGLLPLTQDHYRIAVIASECKMRTIFENYLFFGNQQSNRKRSETFQNETTDTVKMYLPLQPGLDFVLQVCVSSSVGQHFFDARMGLVDHLEGMLGNQIFAAMELSCLRKEEKENHVLIGTKAIQVIPEGDDFGVEVYLGFEKGYDMYTELFPF